MASTCSRFSVLLLFLGLLLRQAEATDRYVPFVANALDYNDAVEKDNKVKGNCKAGQPPLDEPDAQTTKDSVCRETGPCQISYTEEGESVTYKFKTSGSDGKRYADITARVSSKNPKKFEMKLFNGRNADETEQFRTKGKGFDDFYDVTWRRVPIDMLYDHHRVVVTFTDGNINMCSIRVDWSDKNPTPAPHKKPTRKPTPKPTPSPHHPEPARSTPAKWSAFEYSVAYDNSYAYEGNCHKGDRDDGVDGSYTSDKVCINRDDSECHIGWTRPGEWLQYDFFAEEEGRYNVRARVSTNLYGKYIRFRLTADDRAPFGKEIDVPAYGWRDFSDVVWKNVYLYRGHYELQVYFSTGYVNLCSAAVYRSASKPTRKPTRHPTRHPTHEDNYNDCEDDEGYRYFGYHWKDCHWVYQKNKCFGYQHGVHIGENYCRKSCGYCNDLPPTPLPTPDPTVSPTKSPTRDPATAEPTRFFVFRPPPTAATPAPTPKETESSSLVSTLGESIGG